jgi:uncharacterized protein (TIGR00255 family)
MAIDRGGENLSGADARRPSEGLLMVSSMTGFARIEGASGPWSWAVEARSVNGRNLEVRFRGPQGFESLERATREAAQARFQRGQLTVGVQARRSETASGVRINVDQLERYIALSERLAAEGRAERPRIDGLLALRGVLEAGDEDDDPEARAAIEAAMGETLVAALDALRAARLQEGAAVAPVLAGLVDRIETLAAQAEAQAAEQSAAIRDRFERRLTELLGEAAQPERVLQEAAVMAAKADVREELDRLAGHVGAARALLAEEASVGRRLDFLTQEFMREANTLCSKSATADLTTTGLALKAAIDQLREQVQNVE